MAEHIEAPESGREPLEFPVRRRRVWPVVAVNAALVAALLVIEFGPAAVAQNQGQAARPRGEYMMVGGDIQTGNSNAVYIIDSVNQEMIVLNWQDGRNVLDGIGYRDLDADAQAEGRR